MIYQDWKHEWSFDQKGAMSRRLENNTTRSRSDWNIHFCKAGFAEACLIQFVITLLQQECLTEKGWLTLQESSYFEKL